jgi:hypothetical protein
VSSPIPSVFTFLSTVSSTLLSTHIPYPAIFLRYVAVPVLLFLAYPENNNRTNFCLTTGVNGDDSERMPHGHYFSTNLRLICHFECSLSSPSLIVCLFFS